MKIEFTVDIVLEPVTLAEVKEALKITGSAGDDELERLITDARMYIEKAIDTSVSTRTIKVTSLEEFEEWELPYGPVSGLALTYGTNWESVITYIYTYTGGTATTPGDIKRLITDYIKYTYDIDDEAVALPQLIKKQIQSLTRQPAL